MVQYIHYGYDYVYDPSKVSEPSKRWVKSKPNKGLWGSRVDARYGWKDWCLDNDFRLDGGLDFSFNFILKPSAKILNVYSEDDILDYVIQTEQSFRPIQTKTCISDELNCQKLYNDYDGMELFLSDNFAGLQDSIFQLWDCDSIVVWNPDVIEVVDND